MKVLIKTMLLIISLLIGGYTGFNIFMNGIDQIIINCISVPQVMIGLIKLPLSVLVFSLISVLGLDIIEKIFG